MLDTITGGQKAIHVEPIYWEHEGNAAMRWGNWKLVREYNKPWELYDISQDRTELRDLSGVKRGKRNEMVSMWETWATQNQVAFPERFNMYEFLRKKRNESKKKKQ
jgi:arylsulfatase